MGVDVGPIVEIGSNGENRFTTGCRKTAEVTAPANKRNDNTNHCRADAIRAWRVL